MYPRTWDRPIRACRRRTPTPSGGYVRGATPVALVEALDEGECRVGDLPPAGVDGQRVSPVWHLDELGHARVVLLPAVDGLRDGPWDGVVLLPRDDQHRPAVGAGG